jgi:hypothetical protein
MTFGNAQARRWCIRAALAAGVAYVALLSGCESELKPTISKAEYGGGQLAAPGVRVIVAQVDDLPSTGSEAAREGPVPSLAMLLAKYENEPSLVNSSTVKAWRGCGLRIVTVPKADVDALQKSLNVVGPLENRWLGEVPQWVEVAHSPEIALPVTMRLDNGPLTVSQGTLRLLLRAWIAPVAGDEATRGVLQLEMVPDFNPPREQNALIFNTVDRVEAAPIPFWRLQLQAALDGDQALLIVPEEPDVNWGNGESPAAADAKPGVMPKPKDPLGPSAPPAPTLGELLLDRMQTNGRRTRTVMLLTAQVPGEYRLLP